VYEKSRLRNETDEIASRERTEHLLHLRQRNPWLRPFLKNFFRFRLESWRPPMIATIGSKPFSPRSLVCSSGYRHPSHSADLVSIPTIARCYLTRTWVTIAIVAIAFTWSFLPFFLWWQKTGHFIYIADWDNQYYLQLASSLYYGHLYSMRDPVLANSPTMYQLLQFAPAVLLARVLNLSVFSVNLVWHFWAAVAIPLSLYLLFVNWLRRPWAAAFCTIMIMADSGIITAEPFLIQFLRVYQAATSQLPVLYGGQDFFTQWRFIDPAVGMPFLILQICLVSAAVERPTERRFVIAAAISTGVLFYVWFYYWTAAVGALLIASVLDRNTRRLYWTVLGGAVALGLPAIVNGLLTKALFNGEAFQRTGYFASVGRLQFILLPKVALIALCVSGVWIWRHLKREYLYLWCLALAAIVLSDNHIVSGLDLRAGHWRFVWGTALAMLILLALVEVSARIFRSTRWAMILLALLLVSIECSFGLALRVVEVDRSIGERYVLSGWEAFLSQGVVEGRQRLRPQAVIGGDEELCDLLSIADGVRPLGGYAAFLSEGIGDREWQKREALNAYLAGMSERQFRVLATALGGAYDWRESADSSMSGKIELGMMQEFERVKVDSRSAIGRFDVRYVVLPTARAAPEYLKRGWYVVESGPKWRVWRRL
jgi:hypothetical protein